MLISKTDWFQGILVVFSAASSYMIGGKGRDRKWGFALGTIQQPLWVFTAYEAGLWGMFLLTCFYCYTWTRGLWNNWWGDATISELDRAKRLAAERCFCGKVGDCPKGHFKGKMLWKEAGPCDEWSAPW